MKILREILAVLGLSVPMACSGSAASSTDDGPKTLAEVETRADSAYEDGGTIYAQYASTLPGIEAWVVSASPSNAIVYSGLDKDGTAQAQFVAVLDSAGQLSAAASRVADSLDAPTASVFAAATRDIGGSDATTGAKSLSHIRLDDGILSGDQSALVESGCNAAAAATGTFIGKKIGGMIPWGVGTTVGPTAGGMVGGMAGKAAGSAGCPLVRQCGPLMLQGMGELIASGEMAQAGDWAGSAAMNQQGQKDFCPSSGSSSSSGSLVK